MRSIQVTALDFDGVICDSIVECLFTSYEAFLQLDGYRNLPIEPKSEWKELFLKNRGFVRPARDYLKLWQWILCQSDSNLVPKSLTDTEVSLQLLNEFESIFFELRWSKIEKNAAQFVKENPFYEDVVEVWDEIPKPIYIVTAKDEAAVDFLLRSNHLEVEAVYGKSMTSKPKSLQEIASIHSLSIEKIKFFDDNPDHVSDARKVGANSRLVGWGYGPYSSSDIHRLNSPKEMIEFLNHG